MCIRDRVKISSTELNGQGRILRDRYKGWVKSIRGRKHKTVYAAEHLRIWLNGQGRILRDRYKGRVKSIRGRKHETVYAAEHLA